MLYDKQFNEVEQCDIWNNLTLYQWIIINWRRNTFALSIQLYTFNKNIILSFCTIFYITLIKGQFFIFKNNILFLYSKLTLLKLGIKAWNSEHPNLVDILKTEEDLTSFTLTRMCSSNEKPTDFKNEWQTKGVLKNHDIYSVDS